MMLRKNLTIALPVCLAAAAAALAASAADASSLPEEERITQILSDALRTYGADMNRCFERALADRLDVAGRVELSVEVGPGGHVARAVAARDEVGSPVLVACLCESAAGWHLGGLPEGSTVVLPLGFAGQAAQFSVKAADAPEHGPAAAAAAKAGRAAKKPAATPPFSVKLLVDETTTHARQLSVSLLTVSPASRIAMHTHPGAELLYVVKGHARILGPSGTSPEKIDEGAAAYLAPGMPHVIENMGRQTPVVLLDVFAPPGPERVWRDPTDQRGRDSFVVIRDPAKAMLPPSPPAPMTVATTDKTQAVDVPGVKGGRVRVLLDTQSTRGGKEASLGVLDLDPGAELVRHSHQGSEEVLYVLAGTGELTVGSEKIAVGPEQALYLPSGQPHALKVHGGDHLIAVQIFAPAGGEQDRTAPPAKPTQGAPRQQAPKAP